MSVLLTGSCCKKKEHSFNFWSEQEPCACPAMSHDPLPSHHAVHTGRGFGAKSFSQTCAMMPAARASPRTLVIVRSRSLRRDSARMQGVATANVPGLLMALEHVSPRPECPSHWCWQRLCWFCRYREKTVPYVSPVLGQHLSHPACVSSAGTCQCHLPNRDSHCCAKCRESCLSVS